MLLKIEFMKKLFVVLFIAILALSCSTDNSDARSNAIRVSKMIVKSNLENDYGAQITEFYYNGKKLKEVMMPTGNRLEYIYESDNIVIIKVWYDNELQSETFYAYDNKGRVSSETIKDYDGFESKKTLYSYNANHVISYENFFTSEFNQGPTGETGIIYNDAKGQTFKTEKFINNQLWQKIVFTYDTKNSPFKNVTGFSKLPMQQEKFYNNLTKQTYNGDGELRDNKWYEYIYNADNYPTQCIRNYSVSGNNLKAYVQYIYE